MRTYNLKVFTYVCKVVLIMYLDSYELHIFLQCYTVLKVNNQSFETPYCVNLSIKIKNKQ